MEIKLKENEKIDDLEFKNLKINKILNQITKKKIYTKKKKKKHKLL